MEGTLSMAPLVLVDQLSHEITAACKEGWETQLSCGPRRRRKVGWGTARQSLPRVVSPGILLSDKRRRHPHPTNHQWGLSWVPSPSNKPPGRS